MKKKSLTLVTLLLGCCLAVVAQMNQPPAASTPSTFPQDQTGQAPSNPSALPPDTSASGEMSSSSTQASHPPATTAQGCLTQAADGNFILSEASGNKFRLHGDTAQLAAYIGDEIRVDGVPMIGDEPSASSMSSPTSSDSVASDSSSAARLTVTEIHKLSDTCASSN